MPCDYASYNESARSPRTCSRSPNLPFRIRSWRASPSTPEKPSSGTAHHAQRPPTRISDVDDGAFRSSDLYREFYLSLGITAQVAFYAAGSRASGRHRLSGARPTSPTRCAHCSTGPVRIFIQAFRTVLEFDELQRGRNAGGRPSPRDGLPAVAERLGVTTREGEVLRALALGADTATIAVQLGIAPRTVQKHLENAYAKLGVTPLAAAAAVWAALPD